MEFDAFAALARSRRTSMVVDRSRDVPHDLIVALCDLAQWAPNHKRTWPWRFALLEGGARARLGSVMANVLESRGVDSARIEKTRGKYLRTPAVLAVGTAPGDSAERTSENRDAVAASIQTFMLGAATVGLATYWGSCPTPCQEAVAAECGFDPGTHITALIYLGWSAGAAPIPERPPVDVTFLE